MTKEARELLTMQSDMILLNSILKSAFHNLIEHDFLSEKDKKELDEADTLFKKCKDFLNQNKFYKGNN